jgi:cytidine deaminase
MTENKIHINYSSGNSWEQLSNSDRELLEQAKMASSKAYAPYSHFKVGAAVRLREGHIITGCNQENASYSLCNCAERVALHKIFSEQPNAIADTIAIYTEKIIASSYPATPCGACRQVMSEYENLSNHPLRVLISRPDEQFLVFKTSADLLPLGFDSSFLR